MAVVRSATPSLEPVTLAEVKANSAITTVEDDVLIGGMIRAAREKIEFDTRRSLITQTWSQYMDQFPCDTVGAWPNAILIEPVPTQSVTSLTYIDTDGTVQTLTEGVDFTVDTKSEPARVVPYYGTVWPSTRYEPNAVTLTVVAGYGDATSDVPEQFKQAIMMLVGHWYENRETVITGTIVAQTPYGYQDMVRSLKMLGFV